jgi:hypothetical protein
MATEPAELQERIRCRTYELSERIEKGGWDLADWLLAESKLNQKKARSFGCVTGCRCQWRLHWRIIFSTFLKSR